MVEKDYYRILGINPDTSEEEIKTAYRKLALRYHPDRCSGNPESEEKFKEVNEAYAVLGDRDKRREYDYFGPHRFSRRYREDDLFRAFDFEGIIRELGLRFGEDLIDEFFYSRQRRCCGRGRRKSLRRGFNWPFLSRISDRDSRQIFDLRVSEDEAIRGTEREIVVKMNGRRRRYLIHIPQGVMNGTRLRIPVEEETIYLEIRVGP